MEEPRLYAIALLVVVFLITAAARKISRALELANWGMVGAILVGLILVDLFIVPLRLWWEGIRGFFTPAMPPEGITATQLGALAGFTALASGLNWYVMGHYRDKGYGMGSRVGYLSGLRGESQAVRPVGLTFADNEKNAALWKRWMGFLKLDMWVVFFGGAMIGMYLPIILMRQMVLLTGEKPTQANVPTFVANALDAEYGRWLFYTALFVGFLILFDTQLGIFEALVRNMTDAVNTSPRLQQAINGDPRRFYYPFMIVLTAVIGLFLQFFQPATLVLISANMSNFGALIFPFMLMYLNSKLPRTARPRPWINLVLVLNFLFFGFFFVNFVFDQLTGEALVQF
jgi:hypothetical protein